MTQLIFQALQLVSVSLRHLVLSECLLCTLAQFMEGELLAFIIDSDKEGPGKSGLFQEFPECI